MAASNKPRVTYHPRPDATPEGERVALACVYRFIIDCHAKKEAARRSRFEDDVKGRQGTNETKERRPP